MAKIRELAARHPRIADALLATGLAAAFAKVTAEVSGLAGVGWVWFAALHLPLVWRRRRPVLVYWTVVCMAFAAVTAGVTGPYLLGVPFLAAYTLGRHRPRRDLWPAMVAVVPFTVGWLANGGPLWDAVALAAMFALCLLLGTYRAELADRARRLAREREQQERLAVAAERARIAREMHDIVAHNLAVLVALADGAAAITPVAPERGVAMMEQASATGREALAEIRRLVGLLRDGEPVGGTAPQPGFDDIDDLIEQVRAAGLTVALTTDGVPGDWGPGAGLAVYRIVQEALTNTMKHAGPRATARVRLRYDEVGADVVIDDDGDRPHPHQPGGGHGLTGMTERAASFHGHVEAGPRPGRGWRVHARLALAQHPAPA